jgi:hypothetical protein
MKYLKKIFENERYNLFINKEWSDFTKELFKKYCEKFGTEVYSFEYVVKFFNELDYEYEGSSQLSLYQVVAQIENLDDYTHCICDALGEKHALIKATLNKDNDNSELYDFCMVFEITDEDIDRNLKEIEDEYERKKNIWNNII